MIVLWIDPRHFGVDHFVRRCKPVEHWRSFGAKAPSSSGYPDMPPSVIPPEQLEEWLEKLRLKGSLDWRFEAIDII